MATPARPTAQQGAAGIMAAVLLSSSIAAPHLVYLEGWVNRGYPDLVGKATACGGVTEGVQLGKVYSDPQCMTMTGQALVKIGFEIVPCLPPIIPAMMRAAFTLTAYNIGSAAFCASSMSARALAGDLAGACAAEMMWTKVTINGRKVVNRGLEKRRAYEKRLCEQGLTHDT